MSIEQRDGGYWIKGTRVSLDSVVYSYLRGHSPQTILESFPILTLEEVNESILYYQEHKTEVDVYLQEEEKNYGSST